MENNPIKMTDPDGMAGKLDLMGEKAEEEVSNLERRKLIADMKSSEQDMAALASGESPGSPNEKLRQQGILSPFLLGRDYVGKKANTTFSAHSITSERGSPVFWFLSQLFSGYDTNYIQTVTETTSTSSVSFDQNSFIVTTKDVNIIVDVANGMGVNQVTNLNVTKFYFDELNIVTWQNTVTDVTQIKCLSLKDISPELKKAIGNAQTDRNIIDKRAIQQRKDDILKKAQEQFYEQQKQQMEKPEFEPGKGKRTP